MGPGVDPLSVFVSAVFFNDSIEGITIQEVQQLAEEAYIYVRHGREFVSIPKLGKMTPCLLF